MAGRDALRIPPKDNVNACAMSPTSISLAICQTMAPSLGTYLMFWNIMDTNLLSSEIIYKKTDSKFSPYRRSREKEKIIFGSMIG